MFHACADVNTVSRNDSEKCKWSSMGVADVNLWHNPYSAYPIERNLFKVNQVIPKETEIYKADSIDFIEGKKSFEILQIKEYYLNNSKI